MKTNITIISIACMCASLISCQEVPYVTDNTPEVVGLAVEDVAAESCTLRAEISWGNFSQVNFEYSQDRDFQDSETVKAYSRTPHYISELKGLHPGTQYFYRCIVSNRAGQKLVSYTDEFTTDTRYPQYISWSQNTVYYLDTPYIKLNAESSSGLPVSYRVTEGSSVVSVEDYTLTIHTNGVAVVEAYQDGNDNYYPAKPVSKTFEIKDNKLIISDVTVDDWQSGGSISSEVEI